MDYNNTEAEAMEKVYRKARREQQLRELKDALLGLMLNFISSFLIASVLVLLFCWLVDLEFRFNYVGVFMLVKVAYRYFKGGK